MKTSSELSKVSPKLKSTLMACLKEGGSIIRHAYGRAHSIRKKSPVSLVTETDMAADRAIRRRILKAFPDHGIMTEEQAAVESRSPYRWIIDPLDGTTNFAHQIPLFAVSIGLEYQGDIVMGGIYNPVLKELFFAEKGKGALLNGKRIRVSRTGSIIDSLLVTGFPYDRQKKARFYLKFVQGFMQRCRGVRRLGAASIDLAYVACGRFEAYWEFNLKPWDMAAGKLIVQEAGGRVTDFKGGPVDVDLPAQTLASNVRVHKKMLRIFLKYL